MFRIALRTLRFRKGGFTGTLIALFFGASMVMACGGLMETGVRGEVPPQRLAATAMVITGDQVYHQPKHDPADEDEDAESVTMAERVRLDRSLVDKVRAVPGVANAVGDVSFPVAQVRDGRAIPGDSLGHSWDSAALTPYSLVSGREPARPDEVVLDATLASTYGAGVGNRLDLLVHGKTQQVTVSGIATGPVATQSVFFTADSSKVDFIGVIAKPGTDIGALEQRVGEVLRNDSVNILTGDERGAAEFPGVARSEEALVVLAGVIGGFAIMVAMFVVASTLGLSIQHRYRELALLRAIGTTPRQLRRMVLGEALTVGIIATGLAVVPGALLGNWLFDRLADIGIVEPVIEFHQGWLPTVVGIGAGLLTTIAAGLVAARRAGATRPTEALADSAIQRRWVSPMRIILATLCFGGGLALAIITLTVFDGPIAASTAGPSVMVWAIGLALLSPGITKIMTAILRWPLRAFTGTAGYLATQNARARSVRMAAAVTPIMLATGIAVANIYLQTTQVAAAEKAFSRDLRADYVLTSTTGGGVSDDLVDQVRAVPGVVGASEFVASTGYIPEPGDPMGAEGWAIQGISADGIEATAVSVTGGSLADLSGNTVALPENVTGHHIGDTIPLRLGDGSTMDARVVALFKGYAGFEKLLMPADTLAPHTTNGLPAQILIKAGPDARAALERFATGHPGAALADRASVTAAFADDQQMQASVNYLLVGMIMAYTAISVVNTLVMATARRRREFGLQRLTGSTRGQVIRMMSVEALLVTGIAVILGTVLSATTLVPFSLVVADTVWPSGPIWIYLGVVGAAGLMAMAATVLPTWFATRARPAEAAITPD
jgi:putative ABC transport system permease protein